MGGTGGLGLFYLIKWTFFCVCVCAYVYQTLAVSLDLHHRVTVANTTVTTGRTKRFTMKLDDD